MGRKKDEIAEDGPLIESPSKKHKKHKKHKHKKKREHAEEVDVIGSSSQEEQPAIKLKIKIGGGNWGTIARKVITPAFIKEDSGSEDEASELPTTPGLVATTTGLSPSVTTPSPTVTTPSPSATTSVPGELHHSASKSKLTRRFDAEVNSDDDTFKTKKSDADTSDEEKEWLNALEDGTLDDNGRIKKDRDATLLTSRQRALLHGNLEGDLLELPSGYKATELTNEQKERKEQRAKKRREQVMQKREKEKKQTVDRLLKKQQSKAKSAKAKGRSRKTKAPYVRYLDNQTGISISLPEGVQLPMSPFTSSNSRIQAPRVVAMCGVEQCSNPKRYSCSRTGVGLCSLECYKKNMVLHSSSLTAVT